MALPIRVSRTFVNEPADTMQRDFDHVLGRLIGRGLTNGGESTQYPVDVREDPDHIYVEADLPGFKKDEVDITLENQTLTISAEKKESTEKKNGGDLLLSERRYTRFLRSFMLPSTVDEQAVNAKLQDGVLTITLNKREESKPRKITVA